MINKVISDYLKTNKRLIVPQLGAFIHKEGNGIVFVPFLKTDDGVMSSLLLSEYGMDASEVQTVISEFVVTVKSGISEHGFYAINGIGTLKEDVNGAFYLDTDTTTSATVSEQSAKPMQPPVQPVQPVPPVQPPVQPVQPVQPAQRPQSIQSQTERIYTQQSNFQSISQGQRPQQRPQPQGQMPRQAMRPARPVRPSGNVQKADRFMMIAIIAAVLALTAIVYGVIASKDIEPIDKMVLPATENVQDSLTTIK